MLNAHFGPGLISSPAVIGVQEDEPHWYAVYTQSRHEKKSATLLAQNGITTFVPLLSHVHRWSDRRKTVQLPLFPGYVFVRVMATPENRVEVLRTAGVVCLVGLGGAGLPIPDRQIEDLQRILSHHLGCVLYPFLRVGQRVRIHGGCLENLEGILVARNSDRSLVVSIEAIQRSVAIRIEGYEVEILAPPSSSLHRMRSVAPLPVGRRSHEAGRL